MGIYIEEMVCLDCFNIFGDIEMEDCKCPKCSSTVVFEIDEAVDEMGGVQGMFRKIRECHKPTVKRQK